MRALVVEDDPRISRDLASALEAAGFAVRSCGDGEEAWFIGDTEIFDLVVLDLGMPGMDGLSILKRWRGNQRQMPVLILTARGAWTERVEGIEAGADDYLPKPFHMEELVARARGLVRRASGHAASRVAIGSVWIDTNRMTVHSDEKPISVSPLEYRLLTFLALNKGRVIPPTELLEHLYGDDDAREVNAVEAIITRLRRKVGPDVVRTRRGFGYIAEDHVS
ncbi:response regulator transcription factor [Amaricoccus macauensis]|uniref:response regulator transcription factor n=1 Tax=Amaricoccus macauensis TaxID=57001 RepID=UPI003C7ABCCF